MALGPFPPIRLRYPVDGRLLLGCPLHPPQRYAVEISKVGTIVGHLVQQQKLAVQGDGNRPGPPRHSRWTEKETTPSLANSIDEYKEFIDAHCWPIRNEPHVINMHTAMVELEPGVHVRCLKVRHVWPTRTMVVGREVQLDGDVPHVFPYSTVEFDSDILFVKMTNRFASCCAVRPAAAERSWHIVSAYNP